MEDVEDVDVEKKEIITLSLNFGGISSVIKVSVIECFLIIPECFLTSCIVLLFVNLVGLYFIIAKIFSTIFSTSSLKVEISGSFCCNLLIKLLSLHKIPQGQYAILLRVWFRTWRRMVDDYRLHRLLK